MKAILLSLVSIFLISACSPLSQPEGSRIVATPQSSDKVIGRNPDGRTLYQGERGGRYYFSDSGNKVYIDTPEDKMIGKDKEGRFIYQGPRGGMYYYNDKGEKTYIQLHY